MATYANETKNSSSFANQPFGTTGRTWGESVYTWGEADGTWSNPFAWIEEAKNASSFSNVTKN